jgi:hypothetical protein
MVEHGTAVRVLAFAKHGSFIHGTSRWRHLELGRMNSDWDEAIA